MYKKDVDSPKTSSSTLQTLIQAILNYPEDQIADLVQQIRTCESLDTVAAAIVAKENGEDEEEPIIPVSTSITAATISTLESQLSGKMGELRIEDGSTRYIGGTSHLIYHCNSGGVSDSPASLDTYSHDLCPSENPFCSWTTVTSDPELIQHLISMYFCWHYTFFTTLSKSLFLQEFRLGKPSPGSGRRMHYCTPLLVNAMLALGCHFTSWPAARSVPDDSATAGDHFFKESKRLMMEGDLHEVPDLATVQALALMSVREAGCGREAKGWVYSGMSFRMACDLGLNLGMHSKDAIDEKEDDARRITFWGCFLFDKCWSNYLGRMPQLPNSILTVPKVEVLPTEDAETWSAVTDSGLSQAHSQPSRTRATALQISKLCEISSDLMNFFYNPTDINKTKGKQTELKNLSDIHMRLEVWRRELPKELEPKEGGLPHVLVMHMFFQLLYIHLFRPFLLYNPNNSLMPSNISPRRLCTQAATMISKLLRLYRRFHGLRQICNICVYIAHSACTIHLLNLPEKNAKRDIVHGVKHLEEIAEGWLCARRTLRILSDLSKRWKVELPEEAAAVLLRANQKFGTCNEMTTSKFTRHDTAPLLEHQTSSANQVSSSLQPYAMDLANMATPQFFGIPSMNENSVINNNGLVTHSYDIRSLPPTDYNALYCQRTQHHPGTPQSSLTGPSTPASTQAQQSTDGTVTPCISSSHLLGLADQSLQEGLDRIYSGQVPLALESENWNLQSSDEIASWFASTTPAVTEYPMVTKSIDTNSVQTLGGKMQTDYLDVPGCIDANIDKSMDVPPDFVYDESWYDYQ